LNIQIKILQYMIVFKFGGASVSSASSIAKLADLVKQAAKGELVVVVSAFGKTTNLLEKLLLSWYDKSSDRFDIFGQLKRYHREILKSLIPSDQHPVYGELSGLLSKVGERLNITPSEDYDYEYDRLVSFGELASTKIISAYLNSLNIENRWIDARKWLRTDDVFREANVDMEKTRILLRELIPAGSSGIWVTQGFIGGTEKGATTTLGREGSDYTAAIIANLLDARELVVWKDVPGILTADPHLFPEAEKIDELSYQEAIELSFYGAKVIHPKTIKPLQNKGIPLYVKSFADPLARGTVIREIESFIEIMPILIIKKEQLLVSLSPRDFSFVVEDCLSRIFALFFRYRMKVNLIQHSAISFTICMDNKAPLAGQLLEDMKGEFRVLYNDGLELVTIRHYTPESISRHTGGCQVLVEQRSRSTAMFVVRPPDGV
jgi:aspartate kinase